MMNRKKILSPSTSAILITTSALLLLFLNNYNNHDHEIIISTSNGISSSSSNNNIPFPVLPFPFAEALSSTAVLESVNNNVVSDVKHFSNNENMNHEEYTAPKNDNNQHHGDVIVVATVDGTFYGLSKQNGEIVWKSNNESNIQIKNNESIMDHRSGNPNPKNINRMNNNNRDNEQSSDSEKYSNNNESIIFAPLVQTSTTRSSATNSKSSWKTIAVPSIDGRVFLTLGGGAPNSNNKSNSNKANANTNASNRMSRDSTSSSSTNHRNNHNRKDLFKYAIAETTITTSMKDIISRSPFMDSRGRFYVSSTETYAVAIDRDTGEIVKVVNGNKYKNIDNASQNNDNDDHYDFKDIFDDTDDGLNSKQKRNLVWMGRIDYSVSVHDARTGELDVQFSTSDILSLDDMIGESYQLRQNSVYGSIDDQSRMYNSGLLTLPASENEGNDNTLDQENDSFSSKIVTTPGGKVALCNLKTGKVIWIADDTLETPVAFAVGSSSGSSLGVHVVPDAPKANQFTKKYVSSEIQKDLSGNPFFGTGGNDQDMGSTVFGALETGELFALPLGGQRSNTPLVEGLPHVPRLSSTAGMSKHTTGRIPLLSGLGEKRQQGNENNNYAIALKKHFCDPNSANYPTCILESYMKSNDDWFDNNNLNIVMNSDEDFPFQKPIYPQEKPKSNWKFFLKLMTSWIPPAVALAFVVSFEFGRREKLRVEAAKSNLDVMEKYTSNQSDIKPVSKRNGVIDVSDQVLGFGGHGTVVYKGKLEGRYVAVKRMLKAYHASADREISLLIESDGHPNVVRYFLKEVRGDFVYLALELCDMNLQDLINVMAKKRLQVFSPEVSSTSKRPAPISDATKQLLFEIASGVKHIHSLRIVHRDLKPANILLAWKNRDNKVDEDDIYEGFNSKNFVVKISDMGLGKQLHGQSSFGMSTMNNSFMGTSKNEGSTIAGAGPGSVGWQAPEVMAYRLSPESPLLHDESTGADTIEVSPINASNHGRTSRSVDIFSLGCIFFCTILPGSHPFGEWYEREANIMKNCPTTKALKDVTVDAADLILSMLNRSPRSRPTAAHVCSHPFFWSPLKRLSFLCDLSDRLELVDIENSNQLDPFIIEKNAANVVGTAWDTKLDPRLCTHVAKYRKYDSSSVKDCLRLLRNRNHHFDELPADLKAEICSNQEELIEYFESLFPLLLMHCYNTCREYLIFSDSLNKKYEIPSKVGKIEKWSSHTLKSNASERKTIHEEKVQSSKMNNHLPSQNSETGSNLGQAPCDIILWENSAAASSYNCRGWMRSDEEWMFRYMKTKKRPVHLTRCAEDNKFRTRLCNHWDESQGTYCSMRKKNKCDFAHGPIELRVKDGKRNRWGKLVDVNGNCANPLHSGGEDT